MNTLSAEFKTWTSPELDLDSPDDHTTSSFELPNADNKCSGRPRGRTNILNQMETGWVPWSVVDNHLVNFLSAAS